MQVSEVPNAFVYALARESRVVVGSDGETVLPDPPAPYQRQEPLDDLLAATDDAVATAELQYLKAPTPSRKERNEQQEARRARNNKANLKKKQRGRHKRDKNGRRQKAAMQQASLKAAYEKRAWCCCFCCWSISRLVLIAGLHAV